MESELKQHMSNVDEVISLLKQKAKRIEDQRDALQAKCERYEKALKEISGHAGQLIPPKHEMIAIANEALAGDGEKEVELSCMVCGAAFMGPEPKGCCSGRDCGCMGMPIDPIVCSKECYGNLPGIKNKKEGGQ